MVFKTYTLKNIAGTTAKISNYGGILMSLKVIDKYGDFDDIVLGHNNIEDYIHANNKPYFGAIIGRYANRIAKGRFILEGQTFSLVQNNYPNHLHGGGVGFDKVIWSVKQIKGDDFTGLVLSYLSKDGEEGYPGNLDCQVIYKLTDHNEFKVKYRAVTDKATPVNLTHHSYFNLGGEASGFILDHRLMIDADYYTPVDETLFPTGKKKSVVDSPFDFRNEKTIAKHINNAHEQLKIGKGFDHNFVLNESTKGWGKHLVATVYEPKSGRVMEVKTEEPCLQFYTANNLDGRLLGKAGKPYKQYAGLCLETQHYPDSPNLPEFPNTILQVGEVYQSQTTYRFFLKENLKL